MIIVGIFLFALLVVVHEFGHFVAARRAGVEVEEFGIGFPPRLVGRRFGRSKTLYSLNLIPLGGFVKLKGEADADSTPRSFGSRSLSAKTKILLAGVGMNVAAVYVIILLLALTGLPSILPNQFTIGADERGRQNQVLIAQVEADSAAATVQLASGDQLLRINEQAVTDAARLRELTTEHAGQTVTVEYRRDDAPQRREVRLGSNDESGYLGVVPVDVNSARYTWAAPAVAAGVTLQLLWMTLAAIFGLIVGVLTGGGRQAAESVTGPVGVFYLLQNVGSFGLNFLLVLIASISASLAVINVLPIPALDGGRLAVIAGSRLLRRQLAPKVENAIHTAGFMALIGLIILISYLDVQRFF